MSVSAPRVAAPAFSTTPQWHDTDGPEVADLAELAGFAPDDGQRAALDMIFGVDEAGKSAAFEFGIVCPRQNMKTGLFKQAVLGWLYLTDTPLIVWSAHEFRTSQEAHRDMSALVTSQPFLKAQVKRIYDGNGDESIEMKSGQRLIFKARTKSGGRGLTGNKVILDEAFALQASHMGALLPTMLAVPDPQVLYGSSAAQIQSDILRDISARGRRGDPRLAYIEYADTKPRQCAAADCDHKYGVAVGCALDDKSRWYAANPQLGGRILLETIEDLRQSSMPPAEFAREILGWGDEPAGASLIDAETWASCLDHDSEPGSKEYFALDIAPDRSSAAIASVSNRADGRLHVEITSSNDGAVVDHREGTHWLVPRAVQLAGAIRGFQLCIVVGSPAESLVRGLEKAGVRVKLIPAKQVAPACGWIYDQIASRQVAHLGHPELTAAVAAARKRREDGETAFVFGRGKSDGDITPLYAVAIAAWAANTSSKPKIF